MKKTNVSPRMVVDRLERKYQRKIRFQKYKNITKHMRQRLSTMGGLSTKEVDDDSFDTFSINDYEYLAR